MNVEKIHPTAVTTLQGSKELGQQVMALRYDLVHETFQGMLAELGAQIEGDDRRGRPMLAAKLREMHLHLRQATEAAEKLAQFAEPWIQAEKATQS